MEKSLEAVQGLELMRLFFKLTSAEKRCEAIEAVRIIAERSAPSVGVPEELSRH